MHSAKCVARHRGQQDQQEQKGLELGSAISPKACTMFSCIVGDGCISYSCSCHVFSDV